MPPLTLHQSPPALSYASPSMSRNKAELVQVKISKGREGLSHLSDILVGCMGTRLVTSMVEYRAKSWERALG